MAREQPAERTDVASEHVHASYFAARSSDGRRDHRAAPEPVHALGAHTVCYRQVISMCGKAPPLQKVSVKKSQFLDPYVHQS